MTLVRHAVRVPHLHAIATAAKSALSFPFRARIEPERANEPAENVFARRFQRVVRRRDNDVLHDAADEIRSRVVVLELAIALRRLVLPIVLHFLPARATTINNSKVS